MTGFLEGHKVLSFCIFSFFYFPGAFGRASSKPFWFDELVSWYVAKLTSLSDIWNALNGGVDSNPPLSCLFIRASHWVFGTGELATRIPFILGFWLALLFLFLLIAKRCGSLMAYLSILFLCLSASYKYAFEARPYALVLACCCASLFCWESAIEGRFRRLALVGLSLSLGVGLFSHFYAIFLFPPIMIGEAYRSFRSRRVDWPIWISMAAGGAVLIPLVPMMLNYRKEYSEFFWAKPTRGVFLQSIDWFFRDPVLVCFYGVGCLVGVLKAGNSLITNKRNQWAGWNVPSHELIAAMVLMLIPIIGFVLAKFVTHAFYYRYFFPTAIGIALGVAFLYHRLLQGRLLVTAVLLASLLSIFIVRQAVDARGLVSNKLNIKDSGATRPLSVSGDSPVVISNPLLFLQYLHYTPPGLKSRLCYLMDLDAVRKSGVDTPDRTLEELRKRIPMPVEDYRSFMSLHHHFYLYGPKTWLISRLLEDEVHLKVKNMEERRNMLLEVFVDDSLSGKAK
jgi:hypothetical protein